MLTHTQDDYIKQPGQSLRINNENCVTLMDESENKMWQTQQHQEVVRLWYEQLNHEGGGGNYTVKVAVGRFLLQCNRVS